jgi:hypothetical protein
MRRLHWAAWPALTLAAQLAGCARARIEFEKTTDFRGLTEAVVETRNGLIDVRSDLNAQDVQVRGIKSADGRNPAEARAHAEQIAIEVRRDPDRPERLCIAARLPAEEKWHCGASFSVVLPASIALQLKTSNGQVAVTGPCRAVHIETNNGRVNVSNVAGDVYARTTNHPADIINVDGNVDVQTSNARIKLDEVHGGVYGRTSHGVITAWNITGDLDLLSCDAAIEMERVGVARIKAVTSNGRIRALQTRGNATLETTNGPIEVRAASVPDNPVVRVTSTNGPVRVELPGTLKARLKMRTTNAEVHADLKGVAVKDLESGQDFLSATLNGGGGSVDIESTNAPVTFQALP